MTNGNERSLKGRLRRAIASESGERIGSYLSRYFLELRARTHHGLDSMRNSIREPTPSVDESDDSARAE